MSDLERRVRELEQQLKELRSAARSPRLNFTRMELAKAIGTLPPVVPDEEKETTAPWEFAEPVEFELLACETFGSDGKSTGKLSGRKVMVTGTWNEETQFGAMCLIGQIGCGRWVVIVEVC